MPTHTHTHTLSLSLCLDRYEVPSTLLRSQKKSHGASNPNPVTIQEDTTLPVLPPPLMPRGPVPIVEETTVGPGALLGSAYCQHKYVQQSLCRARNGVARTVQTVGGVLVLYKTLTTTNTTSWDTHIPTVSRQEAVLRLSHTRVWFARGAKVERVCSCDRLTVPPCV